MPILDSHVARYLHDLEPRRGGVMLEIEQAAKRGKMPCQYRHRRRAAG